MRNIDEITNDINNMQEKFRRIDSVVDDYLNDYSTRNLGDKLYIQMKGIERKLLVLELEKAEILGGKEEVMKKIIRYCKDCCTTNETVMNQARDRQIRNYYSKSLQLCKAELESAERGEYTPAQVLIRLADMPMGEVPFPPFDPDSYIPPTSGSSSSNPTTSGNTKGCYIATCVYGSYDCPEVWVLRRYRDNKLGNSWLGKKFIKMYYAISPKAVELFGRMKWFNKLGKFILDKFISNLRSNGVDNTPYSDI